MKPATLMLAATALVALPAASMAQQGPTTPQQKHITGKDRAGKATPTGAADEKGSATVGQQGPTMSQQQHITGKDRGGKVTPTGQADMQKQGMDKDRTDKEAAGVTSKEKGTTGEGGSGQEDKKRGRNSPAEPTKQ